MLMVKYKGKGEFVGKRWYANATLLFIKNAFAADPPGSKCAILLFSILPDKLSCGCVLMMYSRYSEESNIEQFMPNFLYAVGRYPLCMMYQVSALVDFWMG